MDFPATTAKTFSFRKEPPLLFLSYGDTGLTRSPLQTQLSGLPQNLNEVSSAIIDLTNLTALDTHFLNETTAIAVRILSAGVSVNVLYPQKNRETWRVALDAFPKSASLIPVKTSN